MCKIYPIKTVITKRVQKTKHRKRNPSNMINIKLCAPASIIKTIITKRANKENRKHRTPSNLIPIKQSNLVTYAKCKMAFLNPWSLANKATSISDFILTNNIDLLAVCESWLRSDGSGKPQRIHQHEMLPSSHQILHIPRPGDKRAGGVALLLKKAFQIKILDYTKECTEQLEYLIAKVIINKTAIRILTVYRPNPTTVNNLRVKLFW